MSLEDIYNEEIDTFMENTKPITLTRNEALFIDDNITLMLETDEKNIVSSIRSIVPSALVPVPLDLVEKIGMAILATTDPDRNISEYTVEFTLSEIFTIREIATSFIKVGKEAVGWQLKRKVYRALFENEYKERKAFESLVKDLPFPSWDIAEETVEKKVD